MLEGAPYTSRLKLSSFLEAPLRVGLYEGPSWPVIVIKDADHENHQIGFLHEVVDNVKKVAYIYFIERFNDVSLRLEEEAEELPPDSAAPPPPGPAPLDYSVNDDGVAKEGMLLYEGVRGNIENIYLKLALFVTAIDKLKNIYLGETFYHDQLIPSYLRKRCDELLNIGEDEIPFPLVDREWISLGDMFIKCFNLVPEGEANFFVNIIQDVINLKKSQFSNFIKIQIQELLLKYEISFPKFACSEESISYEHISSICNFLVFKKIYEKCNESLKANKKKGESDGSKTLQGQVKEQAQGFLREQGADLFKGLAKGGSQLAEDYLGEEAKQVVDKGARKAEGFITAKIDEESDGNSLALKITELTEDEIAFIFTSFLPNFMDVSSVDPSYKERLEFFIELLSSENIGGCDKFFPEFKNVLTQSNVLKGSEIFEEAAAAVGAMRGLLSMVGGCIADAVGIGAGVSKEDITLKYLKYIIANEVEVNGFDINVLLKAQLFADINHSAHIKTICDEMQFRKDGFKQFRDNMHVEDADASNLEGICDDWPDVEMLSTFSGEVQGRAVLALCETNDLRSTITESVVPTQLEIETAKESATTAMAKRNEAVKAAAEKRDPVLARTYVKIGLQPPVNLREKSSKLKTTKKELIIRILIGISVCILLAMSILTLLNSLGLIFLF